MVGDLAGKVAIANGAGQTIVVDGGSTLPESQVVMDGFHGQ